MYIQVREGGDIGDNFWEWTRQSISHKRTAQSIKKKIKFRSILKLYQSRGKEYIFFMMVVVVLRCLQIDQAHGSPLGWYWTSEEVATDVSIQRE